MKFHRFLALALCLITMLMLLPVQGKALDQISQTEDISLTLSYMEQEMPLTDAQFDLYLVATVDEVGILSLTEQFVKYPVDLVDNTSDQWKALATTLEGYVLHDQLIPVDSGKTDANGLLKFPTQGQKLPAGLYLVIGQRHKQSNATYTPESFLVHLPQVNGDVLEYDVTVNPKFTVQPDEPIPPVTRKVLKVWKDAGHENKRPAEIKVHLLRDGVVYDTVILNQNNNWRYTWDNLSSDHRWTVVETKVNGYKVSVTQEGITFVITNTYEEPPQPTTKPPKPPKLPQTGQLWWPVPVLTAVGLLLVVAGLIQRRETYEA